MKILVTGGAGFIGSHVVDRLVNEGHETYVLDNLDPQVHGDNAVGPTNILEHVEEGRVEFIHGDVRDFKAVERALDPVNTVIHLAAAVGVGQSMYAPHYYTSVNVDGQGVLMEVMARDKDKYASFVVASSMSNYGEGAYRCSEHGESAPPPRRESRLSAEHWEVPCPECGREMAPILTNEDKPLQSTSIYSISKKTQEEMALCFGETYGIPTQALRFFNVFGSRQALSNPYTGVAAIFMSRLKNGNRPLVFEDGKQSRDFIHVSDVAKAVVQTATKQEDSYGVFNVCTGRATTIADVARELARALGKDLEPMMVGRYRAGDIRHCVGDPTAAREQLQFEAGTSFEDGLKELIAWSEAQQAVDQVGESLQELERHGLVR